MQFCPAFSCLATWSVIFTSCTFSLYDGAWEAMPPPPPEFCLVHYVGPHFSCAEIQWMTLSLFSSIFVCLEGRYIWPRFCLLFNASSVVTARNSTEFFTTCLEVGHIWKWMSIETPVRMRAFRLFSILRVNKPQGLMTVCVVRFLLSFFTSFSSYSDVYQC